jgi:uncharacterized protein
VVRLIAMLVLFAACREIKEPIEIEIDAAAPTIRVATFNVRRFFDTVCASGACAAGDYEEQPSAAVFEARATELAFAIRTLDADVIALEEVETQACLDALLARIDLHGVLGEIGTTASVDVAILSKTPITQVVRHRDGEPLTLSDGRITTFSRELLEVHTEIGGGEVILFAAHFKAKSDDDPPRRLAEAQVSARIVNEVAAAAPSALVLLAGDLNDTPGSPPLEALSSLVRLADDLAPSAQATYYFQNSGQAIDHILLAPTQAARRIPKSARVWRDNGRGWGGSDHAALSSELAFP